MNVSRAADLGMGDGVRQERRRCPRRTFLDHGQMVVVEFGSAEAGLLVDLSLKGINVQAAKAIPAGTRITSKFQLPGSTVTIQPTYEVVWTEEKGKAGLRFLYMAESDQRELERWMAAQIVAEPPRPAPPTPIISVLPRRAEAKNSDKDVLGLEFRPSAPVQSAGPKLAVQNAPLSSLESRLNELVEEARHRTEADGAAIALRDEQGIVCRARAGDAPDLGVRLNLETGLSAECVRTSKVVICTDAALDPRVPPQAIEQLRLSSALVVPVHAAGSVVGIVEVLSWRTASFGETHCATLERIAATLASFLTGEDHETSCPATTETTATEVGVAPTVAAAYRPLRSEPAAEEPLELEPVVEFEPRPPKSENLRPMLVMGTSAPDIAVSEAAIPFGDKFLLSSYLPARRPPWVIKAIPLLIIILVLLSTLVGWIAGTGRFPFLKGAAKTGSSQVVPVQPAVAPTRPAAPGKTSENGAKPLSSPVPTRPVQVIPLKPTAPAHTGKAPKPAPRPEQAPKSKPRAE